MSGLSLNEMLGDVLDRKKKLDSIRELVENGDFPNYRKLRDEIIEDPSFNENYGKQVLLVDKMHDYLDIQFEFNYNPNYVSDDSPSKIYERAKDVYNQISSLYYKYGIEDLIGYIYARLVMQICRTIKENCFYSYYEKKQKYCLELLNELVLVANDLFMKFPDFNNKFWESFADCSFQYINLFLKEILEINETNIKEFLPLLTKETIQLLKNTNPKFKKLLTKTFVDESYNEYLKDIREDVEFINLKEYGENLFMFILMNPDIFKKDEHLYSIACSNLFYKYSELLCAADIIEESFISENYEDRIDEYPYLEDGEVMDAYTTSKDINKNLVSSAQAEYLLVKSVVVLDKFATYKQENQDKLDNTVEQAYNLLKKYPANNVLWENNVELMHYRHLAGNWFVSFEGKYDACFVYALFSKLKNIQPSLKKKIFEEDEEFAALIKEWTAKRNEVEGYLNAKRKAQEEEERKKELAKQKQKSTSSKATTTKPKTSTGTKTSSTKTTTKLTTNSSTTANANSNSKSKKKKKKGYVFPIDFNSTAHKVRFIICAVVLGLCFIGFIISLTVFNKDFIPFITSFFKNTNDSPLKQTHGGFFTGITTGTIFGVIGISTSKFWFSWLFVVGSVLNLISGFLI